MASMPANSTPSHLRRALEGARRGLTDLNVQAPANRSGMLFAVLTFKDKATAEEAHRNLSAVIFRPAQGRPPSPDFAPRLLLRWLAPDG